MAAACKIEYDKFYNFSEPMLQEGNQPLQWYATHFMRTHSRHNDPADVQTQVWQCTFEPDPDHASEFKNIVATCGGTSVCFIDVSTGEVKLKYSRAISTSVKCQDSLYALAWSSIPMDDLGLNRINIVAAGGGRSTVLLMHPDGDVCYHMFRTMTNKASVAVCSLLFHPKKATWLFCGHEDGSIQLWDIGVPRLPKYETKTIHMMTIPAVVKDAYNLCYSQQHDLLLAGCDGGLFAWHMDVAKVEKKEPLHRVDFIVPEKEFVVDKVVDSIVMLRDDLLALKCALHELIYVFSLELALEKVKTKSEIVEEVLLKDNLVLKLAWSDTDNFYMNMGADKQSALLVCGDDKGTLWVYDLFSYVTGDKKNPLVRGGKALDKPVHPCQKLVWPELEDPEVEKARKVRLDAYDIVIDKCTVSSGGEYIVAVTSNNMVCIWKRDTDMH